MIVRLIIFLVTIALLPACSKEAEGSSQEASKDATPMCNATANMSKQTATTPTKGTPAYTDSAKTKRARCCYRLPATDTESTTFTHEFKSYQDEDNKDRKITTSVVLVNNIHDESYKSSRQHALKYFPAEVKNY